MTATLVSSIWQGVIILFGGVLLGMVYKGFDRKLAAQMQGRIGPPLRQPFYDVVKLMIKENIVPDNAVGWLYNLMPIVALVAAATLLFYIPLGGFLPLLGGYGDLILILYLLATVGAQREMVMMMAYEFPLAVTLVSIAWRASYLVPGEPVFSLSVLAANPLWGAVGPLGAIGLALLFCALFIVTPAELTKIPFDIPEAETEIAGRPFLPIRFGRGIRPHRMVGEPPRRRVLPRQGLRRDFRCGDRGAGRVRPIEDRPGDAAVLAPGDRGIPSRAAPSCTRQIRVGGSIDHRNVI